MKKLLLLYFSVLLFSCSPTSFLSNILPIHYYVHVQKALVVDQPNSDAQVLKELKEYDNLKFVEDVGDWFKVRFDTQDSNNSFSDFGYVQKVDVKKGKAVPYNYTYRTGAICNDGTSSSATGRGACSRHGGVSSWKTKTIKKMRIKE